MEVAHIQGDKTELRSLPSDYKNLLNFAKRSEEEWNENGFYRVVRPALTEGKKYGTGGLVENEFVIPLVDKTQAELDAEALQRLNSDVSQQQIDQRRYEGQTYYDRIFAKIERLYRAGTITGQQAIGAVNYFDPLTEGLNRGQWIIVQSKLNALTNVPAGYKSLYDEIKVKVDAYVQNNY